VRFTKGRILPHGGNLRQNLLVTLRSRRKPRSLRLGHILRCLVKLATDAKLYNLCHFSAARAEKYGKSKQCEDCNKLKILMVRSNVNVGYI
jgi:hypothetical protein